MKIAFASMVFSWLAVVSISAFSPVDWIVPLAILVAGGLSLLWVAHLTAYSGRVWAALWREYGASVAVKEVPDAAGRFERRDVLRLGASALGFGLLAAVWLPLEAFAAGRPCGEGKNCPDDAPNCCSRSLGKCCDGNWACTKTGTCHDTHSAARAKCGSDGVVWACG
jgi:hypothetical protein